MSDYASDLVVLVPDRNTEATVRGLLSRPQALGIRPVQYELYVHPERDPGCFHQGHDFLRSMTGRCAYGLLLFDRIGSGREQQTREEIETDVITRLSASGWGDRAAVIVLDPELEVWVWSDSPEVDRCLGWHGQQPDLRTWLRTEGRWLPDQPKPQDPKAATEQALRRASRPRSSALYEQLATSVSLQRCTDAAFFRLRQVLTNWFPPSSTG